MSSLAAFLGFVVSSRSRLDEVNKAETIEGFLSIANNYGFRLRFADIVKYQAAEILMMSDQERELEPNDWGWIVGRGQPLSFWSDVMYQLLKKKLIARATELASLDN